MLDYNFYKCFIRIFTNLLFGYNQCDYLKYKFRVIDCRDSKWENTRVNEVFCIIEKSRLWPLEIMFIKLLSLISSDMLWIHKFNTVALKCYKPRAHLPC